MSFLPDLSAAELEDLFGLFKSSITQVGITPKEASIFQRQLRDRLQQIWNAIDPKPIEMNFDDFRKSILQRFFDRLDKENPQRHRPRS
jgi:hypothetical protein